MKQKQFMVVRLPKDELIISINDDNQLYEDYDEAFECFSSFLLPKEIRQPKGEQPLRYELQDSAIELWVIQRTSENVKTK